MKEQIDLLDATPTKRLYLSIIADYDLNKAICELIDNALDIWVKGGKKDILKVKLILDKDQQMIQVIDNAGGIQKNELSYLIGPGHTGNTELDETIGIFGVGTKRAVVALSQQIKMTTRYEDKKTYQVEYDDKWIEKDDEWELPVFKVNNIENGTTNIELIKLRSKLNEDKISQLRLHLGAIYSKFLRSKNVSIKLNSSKITPIDFENWAYPPNYEPRNYSGVVHTQNGKNVRVNAIAGLSKESSPAGGEYGVYIYCNDRLIAKALKNYDVGFTKGLAGKPHPDLSLTRVIVSINGEARLMPWNSSKSDINTTHEVFIAIRDWLVQVVKDYASLSRRFSHSEGGWPKEVFRYPKGKIIEVAVSDFPTARTSYLPQLPITKPRFGNIIKKENKDISKKKPWTTGLYESIIAVDLLSKQKLEQKNRINLIILDSTLEIAFKEYLVNDSGEQCSNRRLQEIFSNRIQVHNEIKNTDINISDDIWRKILYYYNMRSLIIHQKATVSVSDSDIETFRSIVEDVLSKLFELKF